MAVILNPLTLAAAAKPGARSYSDVIQDQQVEAERQAVMRKIDEKQKETATSRPLHKYPLKQHHHPAHRQSVADGMLAMKHRPRQSRSRKSLPQLHPPGSSSKR